jgi:hypothetical protein
MQKMGGPSPRSLTSRRVARLGWVCEVSRVRFSLVLPFFFGCFSKIGVAGDVFESVGLVE